MIEPEALLSSIPGAQEVASGRWTWSIGRFHRYASPFLRIRYRNVARASYTEGDDRFFMPYDALAREVDGLMGVPDAFVEFETFTGDVWTVRWDNGTIVESGGIDRRLDVSALQRFLYDACFTGQPSPEAGL